MKKNSLLPLTLLAFSAAMALISPGFLEFDELAHFLKARDLPHDWPLLLDIWGRPACTGLFGLAALLGGLPAARLLAVLITGLTALGTAALLDEIPPPDTDAPGYFARTRRGWAWLLLYAQPMFLLNSFTVMTEMLLACAWVWTAVLLARGRFKSASLLLGAGALARPEGVLAVAIWPIYLLLFRANSPKIRTNPPQNPTNSPRILLFWCLSALFLIAWWVAGAVLWHNPKWMLGNFPWRFQSQYGRTGLLFLASALAALAAWMWPPVILGAFRLYKQKNRTGMLLVLLPVVAFFLLHATLGTLGLFGSMSLPRYFLAVSPMIAILCIVGLETYEARTRRPRLLRKLVIGCTIFPALLLILTNQLPVPKSTNDRQLDVAIRAFRQRDLPPAQWPTHLLTAHPYVNYVLDIPLRPLTPEAIQNAPAGTYLITDSILWNREGLPQPQELIDWGYRFDPLVDRDLAHIPPTFDLNGSLLAAPGTMGVGLWIKDR